MATNKYKLRIQYSSIKWLSGIIINKINNAKERI